jgi:hypothetical protein
MAHQMIEKTRCLISMIVALILLGCAHPQASQKVTQAKSAAAASATAVTIHQRQIRVNGQPFTIQGVGYAPTPIGADPELGNPNGDNFTAASSALYQRDLPLLRAMGANTLRLWGWEINRDHTAFLDAAYNQGVRPIYIIASYWLNAGLDLNDPAVRSQQIANFRQMVAAHKNHPAILMWMIGNELNAPWMYGNSDALFSLINEMALAAHQEEGASYHPVTTPLADVNLISTISQRDSAMTNLDVWSVQVYRGNTFGTLFDDYAAASSKPLLISEYGIDAYDDQAQAEYELVGAPRQAEYAADLWEEIEAHTSVCSGGSIMAYSDEWWKGKYGQNDATHTTCPEGSATTHSACGYAASSHPDGYANEEWWGIVRPVKNGSNPDLMQPRAAYRALQSLWMDLNTRVYLPITQR